MSHVRTTLDKAQDLNPGNHTSGMNFWGCGSAWNNAAYLDADEQPEQESQPEEPTQSEQESQPEEPTQSEQDHQPEPRPQSETCALPWLAVDWTPMSC